MTKLKRKSIVLLLSLYVIGQIGYYRSMSHLFGIAFKTELYVPILLFVASLWYATDLWKYAVTDFLNQSKGKQLWKEYLLVWFVVVVGGGLHWYESYQSLFRNHAWLLPIEGLLFVGSLGCGFQLLFAGISLSFYKLKNQN